MENGHFFIEKIRFHLLEENTVFFVGWYFDGKTGTRKIRALFDGKECAVEETIHSGAQVRQKYLGNFNEINEEVIGTVKLPEDWRSGRKLEFYAWEGEKCAKVCAVPAKRLQKIREGLDYYVESVRKEEGKLTVTGWCVGAGEVAFTLLDEDGKELSARTDRYFRKDLKDIFPEKGISEKPGFQLTAEFCGERVNLVMEDVLHHRSAARLRDPGSSGRLAGYMEKAENAFRYLERNGFSAAVRKANAKLGKKDTSSYEKWRAHYETKPEELERQRKTVFAQEPFFSIVVPLYRTKPRFLRELVASVQEQTYGKWELCFADGSADGSLTKILEAYAADDARIRFVTLKENLGISENTNEALKLAKGDFVVFSDHDDLLAPDALFSFADALNRDRDIDVLYSDEDKVSMDGRKYFEPHFKSDYNVDLLCSMNYICHLFAVKRGLLQKAGNFRGEYDGAQDYDFIFRCCEAAERICHVPKILYHWRCHAESTAANPESKLYAFEAGRRAVEAHYRRMGIPARVENAQFYGMYRTVYEWKEEPLVSIIIPNKDHVEDLGKCLGSIYGKTDYPDFEVLIVENNSTEPETFAYYRQLEREHENLRVLYYEGEFHYSRINNLGAAHANGEYLLLLNNDTEMIHENCIRELVSVCMREDVGVVGARLYYGDDTIQHAGAVIGFGGMAGHTFIGKSRYDTGYFGRIVCAQDYSAVTAACLMTKKSVYNAVGGLSEEFRVAFNDIDYCLKVRRLGKLVVYNPYAELYHYESKSRGLEDTPEKVERFGNEVERLVDNWPEYFENGDPYYNPNLTLDNSDFSLRR